MIAVTILRPNGAMTRLRIDRDDDQALDFVLACACRHFGDPSVILPMPPKPKRKAAR